MPRNRKKHAANGGGGGYASHNAESDEELSNDNASVYSYASENDAYNNNNNGQQQMDGEDGMGGGGGGFEKFEEKLLQAIENASDKSLQTRLSSFQIINETLVHHYIPGTIENRKATLMDLIEKSIRKGKGAEQAAAARIIPLLVVHLEGAEDEMTELLRVLKPVLVATAQDGAAGTDARAKCCTALGLLHFLGTDDIGELLAMMKTFESIFAGSYLKGDGSPSAASIDAATLHSAALSAWALLLTLIPPGDLVSMFPSVQKLTGLLQSPHLEVRMTAGETLALILECGRAHSEQFLEDELDELIEATQKLATDAHKFRAKRDRKVQRATFRDVLRYLEEDESPEITIKFGKQESLVLDTWALHHQYICLRNALGFGMNVHLAENSFLRDVLQLGPKVEEGGRLTRLAKAEQRSMNAAAFKARTITRGKNRDKRSAVIN